MERERERRAESNWEKRRRIPGESTLHGGLTLVRASTARAREGERERERASLGIRRVYGMLSRGRKFNKIIELFMVHGVYWEFD